MDIPGNSLLNLLKLSASANEVCAEWENLVSSLGVVWILEEGGGADRVDKRVTANLTIFRASRQWLFCGINDKDQTLNRMNSKMLIRAIISYIIRA